jgi:hypothetical protein
MKRIFVFVLTFVTATVAADQRLKDTELAQSMRSTNVRVAGKRSIVWAPPSWSADKRTSVAASLDHVIAQVEKILGRKQDVTIEYFLSDSDEMPSHVYGGYDHSAADPAIVFLSGLDSGEAPHIHEPVHIIGGKFGSLLLREGLATYVQFALQPGKMRPLVRLGEVTDRKSLDATAERIVSKPNGRELATAWLANPAKKVAFYSRPDRALFYAVSASFVAFLIDRIGIETFMVVYASDDPAASLERVTGKPWKQWTEEWFSPMVSQNPDRVLRDLPVVSREAWRGQHPQQQREVMPPMPTEFFPTSVPAPVAALIERSSPAKVPA